ncbi:Hypothetical protein FKW44_023033, partial [Caligus rogercresseyi]
MDDNTTKRTHFPESIDPVSLPCQIEITSRLQNHDLDATLPSMWDLVKSSIDVLKSNKSRALTESLSRHIRMRQT